MHAAVYLSLHLQSCAEMVVKAMGLPEYADDTGILALGATILRNLACVTSHPQSDDGDAPTFVLSPAQTIVAAGAPAVLEAAMERHPNSASIQENARCALYNLLLIGSNDAKATLERATLMVAALQEQQKQAAAEQVPMPRPHRAVSQVKPTPAIPRRTLSVEPRAAPDGVLVDIPEWATHSSVPTDSGAVVTSGSSASARRCHWHSQFTLAFWILAVFFLGVTAAMIVAFVGSS